MEPRIQRWGEGMNSIINAQQPRTDFDFADIIRKICRLSATKSDSGVSIRISKK